MTTKPILEQLVLSIAPAVTKYHLDLQLAKKSKKESEFALHPDTSKFIAEDSLDIAYAIMKEFEAEQANPRKNKPKAADKKEASINGSSGSKSADKKEVSSNGSGTHKAAASKTPTSTAAKSKAAPAKTKAGFGR